MTHFGAKFLSEKKLIEIPFGSRGVNCLIKENVGLYFTENIYLGNNIRIDDRVIMIASSADAPIIIESFVHIAAGCYIVGKGGVHIKEHSTLGPNVSIFSASDDYNGFYVGGAVSTLPKKLTCEKVTIGPNAIVGSSSVLLPGCILDKNCSLGALSLLKLKTAKNCVYAGTPAKKLATKRKN